MTSYYLPRLFQKNIFDFWVWDDHVLNPNPPLNSDIYLEFFWLNIGFTFYYISFHFISNLSKLLQDLRTLQNSWKFALPSPSLSISIIFWSTYWSDISFQSPKSSTNMVFISSTEIKSLRSLSTWVNKETAKNSSKLIFPSPFLSTSLI